MGAQLEKLITNLIAKVIKDNLNIEFSRDKTFRDIRHLKLKWGTKVISEDTVSIRQESNYNEHLL